MLYKNTRKRKYIVFTSQTDGTDGRTDGLKHFSPDERMD